MALPTGRAARGNRRALTSPALATTERAPVVTVRWAWWKTNTPTVRKAR